MNSEASLVRGKTQRLMRHGASTREEAETGEVEMEWEGQGGNWEVEGKRKGELEGKVRGERGRGGGG
jgi:hypothetical protein